MAYYTDKDTFEKGDAKIKSVAFTPNSKIKKAPDSTNGKPKLFLETPERKWCLKFANKVDEGEWRNVFQDKIDRRYTALPSLASLPYLCMPTPGGENEGSQLKRQPSNLSCYGEY